MLMFGPTLILHKDTYNTILMIALRVNTFIWKSSFNKYVDNKLTQSGVKLLDLQWHLCEYVKNDPEHFTWKGFKTFCKLLKNKINEVLKNDSKIHIISDSTIDYNNYDKNYRYTGKANKFLKLYFNNKVSIDAQCGSGFHAPINFIERLSKVPKNSIVLFIGGWNDYSYSEIKKNIINLRFCTGSS